MNLLGNHQTNTDGELHRKVVNMLLIGSRALNQYNLYPPREKNSIQDIDYICSYDEYEDWYDNHSHDIIHVREKDNSVVVFLQKSYPIEFSFKDTLYNILLDNTDSNNGVAVNPAIVLALKLTHKYLKNSPHFLKTLNDIIFLKDKGYEVPYYLKDWVEKEEKRVLSYSHPNLNRKKEDFFIDVYPYDHDSIHRSIAIFEDPAYEYYKVKDAEVLCSKDLFFAQAEDIRLAGVVEEALVLALERHQIPNDFKPNSRKSFLMALEKVCTSITSGWFREYAYNNYHQVVNLFDTVRSDYVEKFKADLAYGDIIKNPNYPHV